MSEVFVVVAEPARRRILDRLLRSRASVGELVQATGLSQPAVSKHLRVLREHGLVTVLVDAQRRIYSLDARPLTAVDDWLQDYRATWNRHVDALVEHLDQEADADATRRTRS
jgi:DNA-binding transcriptional ArsR family regulator